MDPGDGPSDDPADPRRGGARDAAAGALRRLSADAGRNLQAQQMYHLRRLINATGVIVHTNLGRSLLAPAAVANLQAVAASYSNLEYDLTGERGSRYAHVEEASTTRTGAGRAGGE